MSEHRKVIVIGSGPAGNTAALYTARAGLKPLVLAGFGAGGPPGGQLMLTTEIENFPGFPSGGISGPELMGRMRQQAMDFGAEFKDVDVSRVELKQSPFAIWVDDTQYTADAVIISTGARSRLLGIDGEEKLIARGLHTCATCDGAFYRNKKMIVIGGGDTAMEEATFLTRFGDVNLVHRREEFRASKTMLERARKNPKITWTLNEQPLEYLKRENGTVCGIKARNTKSGQVTDIKADGVFLAIGHIPNTDLFKGQLKMHDNGYLVTGHEAGGPTGHPNTYTSVHGVFACGDVQDHTYRQAITAAGTGCMAAIDAERWLAERE
ncbi:MAG: thioredoxin-disulfide reductase [Planctomycetes bacterium]|nr:thioredoxin-disulfide reductase [Planctomycetota bacterium]MCW8134289.1 thioredoxin-disulfide reductase [Planctomycetota bacterium]